MSAGFCFRARQLWTCPFVLSKEIMEGGIFSLWWLEMLTLSVFSVLVSCAQFDCSTLTDLNVLSSSVCFRKQV